MARRRTAAPEAKRGICLRPWIVAMVAALFLVAALVAGNSTRDAVHLWGRYTVPFCAIDCDPPPGQDRVSFLTEVQYLAAMPDQVSILDEDLPARLAEAFARHPRVQKVEEIVLLPKRRVHVRLRFRNRETAGTRASPIPDEPR
ncbi:MAG TPA: hypothetical protein VKU02_03650 [Gemmataceae bacterium]|nr:hypothetical protein [Gemmataceae bacterium]